MTLDEILVSIIEHLPGASRAPGIYFLARSEPLSLIKIVYVGKSQAPVHRIKSHMRSLYDFNLAFCLSSIPDHVDHGHLEAAIIACLKPQYNGQSKYDSPHRDDEFITLLARNKWCFDSIEVPMHIRR